MADDEVTILRDALAGHRKVLVGARSSNQHLDLHEAFEIHAAISGMLAHWEEFSVNEQRRIVSTIQYVVDTEDAVNDIKAPDGLRDDLAELHKLQEYLGYV